MFVKNFMTWSDFINLKCTVVTSQSIQLWTFAVVLLSLLNKFSLVPSNSVNSVLLNDKNLKNNLNRKQLSLYF
jgi:hypothetical protein